MDPCVCTYMMCLQHIYKLIPITFIISFENYFDSIDHQRLLQLIFAINLYVDICWTSLSFELSKEKSIFNTRSDSGFSVVRNCGFPNRNYYYYTNARGNLRMHTHVNSTRIILLIINYYYYYYYYQIVCTTIWRDRETGCRREHSNFIRNKVEFSQASIYIIHYTIHLP